jgi:hypothetical protein
MMWGLTPRKGKKFFFVPKCRDCVWDPLRLLFNGYRGRSNRAQSSSLISIWCSFYKMTNNMQLCKLIYCSLSALHVSSDIFAHHQEHLNCIYSFWFYSRVSSSAAVVDQTRQQFINTCDDRQEIRRYCHKWESLSLHYVAFASIPFAVFQVFHL